MKGIMSIVVSLILICGTPCETSKEEGTCGGLFVHYPRGPPSKPRPLSAPDPLSYKPLQILYIPLNYTRISRENMRLFQDAFDYVNGLLGKMMKTARLDDIRLSRFLQRDDPSTCDQPECSHLKIPNQYASPCYDENYKYVPEDDITVENRVREYRGKYSLVIYVILDPPGECTGEIAFATNCRADENFRPTHGSITFCTRPRKMHKEQFLNTFLHETLHVLLTNVDGRYIYKGQKDDEYGDEKAVKNITWKYVTRNWHLKASSQHLTTLKIPVTITPNVLEFVQRHFNCPRVEGAEMGLELDDKNIVTTDGWHWSLRLFSDDIMAPLSIPSRRITNLTLSFAKDTQWYEVDMSYAEPMIIDKPQQRGCDVARKSCHEILSSVSHTEWDKVQMVRPYCYSDQRLITPLCSPDGVWRLSCESYKDRTLFCNVAHGVTFPDKDKDDLSKIINHPKCSMATSQPDVAAKYGLKVGPGTMCVTFMDAPWSTKRLIASCVAYECLQGTLVLKFESEGHQCNIQLIPGQFDNKIAEFIFDTDPICQKLFPDLTFIGPDVNVVCSGKSTSTNVTTGKTSSTSTKMVSTNMESTFTSTLTPASKSGHVFTKSGYRIRFLCILMLLGFEAT